MKIFFHAHLTNDKILQPLYDHHLTYTENIKKLIDYGSLSKIGFNITNENHFLAFSNSNALQTKWAEENYPTTTSQAHEVLNAQISKFNPDAILTMTPHWFCANKKKIELTSIKLLCAWKASPISDRQDYSGYDLCLSFNDKYLSELKANGALHTEKHNFCFDSAVKNHVGNLPKQFDLTFSGTYNDGMFLTRTKHLLELNRQLVLRKKIRFYFNSNGKRFLGLYPKIPVIFGMSARRPVFLKDYLEVIQKSRVVFNCHSDSTGLEKGNIRVFETLGMGSFLLTDKGDYPPGLIDGQDFISYSSSKDLLDKAKYFLKNELEREEIAQNGYQAVKNNYSVEHGAKRLEEILARYI